MCSPICPRTRFPRARGFGRLRQPGSCQQLLGLCHCRNSRIDGFVFLAEAQPDEVARRIVLGEGGHGTTATPAFSTAAIAKASSSSEIPEALRSTDRK